MHSSLLKLKMPGARTTEFTQKHKFSKIKWNFLDGSYCMIPILDKALSYAYALIEQLSWDQK